MSTRAPPVVSARGGRVAFLDLLRCLAAFQMIQGHTLAALLAPEHRHGVVHALWSQARGLTSVAFLFAAGFAFYVTTCGGARKRAGAERVSGRRVRRGLQLVAIGYVLHAPIAMWTSADASARAAALRGFLAVDVLQCIGVSLIALQWLAQVARSERSMGIASACIATLLLVLGPAAAAVPVEGALAPLLAYVSPLAGSPFPLLPWAAHMFAGAACAAWLTQPSSRPSQTRLLVLAAMLFALSLGAQTAFGRGLVSMHVARLGCVIVASAALAQLALRLERVPNVLRTLAGSTLTLYVVHILIVYGHGLGLADRIGPRLAPGAALTVTALVLALSVAVALGYDRMRSGRLARTAVAG